MLREAGIVFRELDAAACAQTEPGLAWSRVKPVAGVYLPDDEAGEAPKGFVVLRAGHTATPDEIIAFANGKLAGYKKVHYIEIVESIPKNASGKILRRELKELEKARREGK